MFKIIIRRLFRFLILKLYPDFHYLVEMKSDLINIKSFSENNTISDKVRIDHPSRIYNSTVSNFTYICLNSKISNTYIGKFTSIGPNILCGWGIHPSHCLSTSPSFYSTNPYNGFKFNHHSNFEERKQIYIGNDVFIGVNVTILDGVNISDGAIIAAGAVVVCDVPPYAIFGGIPAKLIKFRFSPEIIKELLEIKWWDWSDEKLFDVGLYFEDVSRFIQKHSLNSK